MVRDPLLFLYAIIGAVYSAFCLVCWAFNIKGTRVAPILFIALASGTWAGFFLIYGVRW